MRFPGRVFVADGKWCFRCSVGSAVSRAGSEKDQRGSIFINVTPAGHGGFLSAAVKDDPTEPTRELGSLHGSP